MSLQRKFGKEQLLQSNKAAKTEAHGGQEKEGEAKNTGYNCA